MELISMPECITVGDKSYKIHTDFRNWIEVEQILESGQPLEKKIADLLITCYIELPPDIESAVSGALAFYAGGEKAAGKGNRSVRCVSFVHDAKYIVSAFYSQYNVDLTSERMHWYKFRALFSGLKRDERMSEIAAIRSVDLTRIKDKNTKKHYRQLKDIYALPDIRSKQEKECDMADALSHFFG